MMIEPSDVKHTLEREKFSHFDKIAFVDLDDTLFSSLEHIENSSNKSSKIMGIYGITKGQLSLRSLLSNSYNIPVTARDYKNFHQDQILYFGLINNVALINYGAMRLNLAASLNGDLYWELDRAYHIEKENAFVERFGESVWTAMFNLRDRLQTLFMNANLDVSVKSDSLDGELMVPCYVKVKIKNYDGEQVCVHQMQCKWIKSALKALSDTDPLLLEKFVLHYTKNGMVFVPTVNTKQYAVNKLVALFNELNIEVPTFSAGNALSDLSFMLETDYFIAANEVKPEIKEWLKEKMSEMTKW